MTFAPERIRSLVSPKISPHRTPAWCARSRASWPPSARVTREHWLWEWWWVTWRHCRRPMQRPWPSTHCLWG